MRNLNVHSLQRSLNDLCLQLNDKYLINNGGCCFVAYMVEDINYSYIKWIYKSGRWNLEYNIHNNRIIRKTFNAFFNGYEERNGLSNH